MTPRSDKKQRAGHCGDVWRATLPPIIGAELDDSLLSDARAAIAGGCREIILDFSRTEYADSPSIGVLILLYQLVQESDVAFAFARLHGQPLVLVERIGLDQRIRMIEPASDSSSNASPTEP